MLKNNRLTTDFITFGSKKFLKNREEFREYFDCSRGVFFCILLNILDKNGIYIFHMLRDLEYYTYFVY